MKLAETDLATVFNLEPMRFPVQLRKVPVVWNPAGQSLRLQMGSVS